MMALETADSSECHILQLLADKLKQVADDVDTLRREFYSLPDDGCDDTSESQRENYSTAVGQMAENKKKNRYKDIIPYDLTRVKLRNIGEESSDYINANFVKGPDGKNAYIACQGPLKNTTVDMWRMIWEYGVRVVIMACNEKEGQKVKCERYWPDAVDETLNVENLFSIRLLSEVGDPEDEYIVRRMRVTLLRDYADFSCSSSEGDQERDVIQYHYVGWPDYGIPDNCSQFIQLLRQMHHECPQSDVPIVVHCSAGCGRTGTIMCVDYVGSLIRLRKIDADLSIKNIVMEMRRQRPAVVQSFDQYVMCFRSVIELLTDRVDEINDESGDVATSDGIDSGNNSEVFDGASAKPRNQAQTHVIARPTFSERSRASASDGNELHVTNRAAIDSDSLLTPTPEPALSKVLDSSPCSPFVQVVSPIKRGVPGAPSPVSFPPSPSPAADQPIAQKVISCVAEPPATNAVDANADSNNNQADWSKASASVQSTATIKRNSKSVSMTSRGQEVASKMQSLFSFSRKQSTSTMPRSKHAASKSLSFDSESVLQSAAKRETDGNEAVDTSSAEASNGRDESRAARVYSFVFRGIDVGFRKLVCAHPQGARNPPWSPPPN